MEQREKQEEELGQ
ncbi:hypothetical protein A2U01_0115502, partial [Trifolium medium]|nr:hypothetical protein [Trifolium medium]